MLSRQNTCLLLAMKNVWMNTMLEITGKSACHQYDLMNAILRLGYNCKMYLTELVAELAKSSARLSLHQFVAQMTLHTLTNVLLSIRRARKTKY
jgi:hypothetical protein